MSVLESAGVHHRVDAAENLVPFLLMLLYGHSLGFGQGSARGADGLLAVNPRGNEGRQAAGDVLAHLAHGVEAIHSSLGGA